MSADVANIFAGTGNSNLAKTFRRSFIHLRPGIFIVYDVTRSNSSIGNKKSWYMQFEAAPFIDSANRNIHAVRGTSKIYIKGLYPTTGTYIDTALSNNANMSSVFHRVKYEPANLQEYDQFLHVIEATDSAASQTSTTAIEGTGGRGVVIGGSTIAMFTADQSGANITSLSYSADTTAASTHYIADLTPGATYNVSIDGGEAIAYTASTAGLIVFTNPNHSPHSYIIVLDGQAVVPGLCGYSNGLALVAAPSTGLCSAGTPSAVTGTGPWAWTCAGSGGGTTENCEASLLEVPPTGNASALVACPVIAGFR